MQQIRRRNGFSDRNGINPINKTIQYNELEDGTRICILNKISRCFDTLNEMQYFSLDGKQFVSEYCFENLFSLPITSRECNYDHVLFLISKAICENEYNDVLDIVEFICTDLLNAVYERTQPQHSIDYYSFMPDFNKLFEEEYVGYRFINNKVVAITNTIEIQEIEKASNSPYDQVNKNFSKAIDFLSNKNKDYENSIKESVSAVEALCKIITGDESGTLGKLINTIEKAKHIHSSLKDSITKLYGFASDVPGIRHGGNKKTAHISFEDAEFVLVTCSAIVNYFISSIV